MNGSDIHQWRLFFAGLYPVEFRDFFLGDMFCSETYPMGVSFLLRFHN
jgi:EXS family